MPFPASATDINAEKPAEISKDPRTWRPKRPVKSSVWVKFNLFLMWIKRAVLDPGGSGFSVPILRRKVTVGRRENFSSYVLWDVFGRFLKKYLAQAGSKFDSDIRF